MAAESGYFFVNSGGGWPKTTLGPRMDLTGGTIGLKKTGAAYATAGSLLAGPFQVSDRPTFWFSVKASIASGLGKSHVQFYTLTAPGGPAPWNPGSNTPFSDPKWKSAPRDALNFALPETPDLVLYIGAFFRGD